MNTRYFIFLLPFLASCGLLNDKWDNWMEGITHPHEPALKGVFLPTATIPSVFTDKQVVYSMLVDSEKRGSNDTTYSIVAPGAEILIHGKRYKFYVDTTRNANAFVNFFIKEPSYPILNKEGDWENWDHCDVYTEMKNNNSLVFNKSGISLYSDFDSIPQRLYGRNDELDARIFLSIIGSSQKITEWQYVPIILRYLNEDSATSKKRGFIKAFRDQGYDPISNKFLNEDTMTFPEQNGLQLKGLKLMQIGRRVSLQYYDKTYEDLSKRFYSKNVEATNYSYVSEFYVMPGDSVWFTGRISGDSAIAFIKK